MYTGKIFYRHCAPSSLACVTMLACSARIHQVSLLMTLWVVASEIVQLSTSVL